MSTQTWVSCDVKYNVHAYPCEWRYSSWLTPFKGEKNYRPAWENHLSNSLHWNWVSIFHIKKNCFISHISIEWNLVSLRLKWQCTSDSLCSICTKMRHHDSLIAIFYGYNWKKTEYYEKKQNQLKRAGNEERMASIFCAISEYMESNSVSTHIVKCRTPPCKMILNRLILPNVTPHNNNDKHLCVWMWASVC